MNFYLQFSPYEEGKLQQIEKYLAITFPSDYRDFLLQYGGGQPENTVFDRLDQNGSLLRRVYVDTFYGETDINGVELFGTCVRLSDRIPSEFIPIGTDGVGNYLCLGIRGKNYGKVFMWREDAQPDIGEKPTLKNMELIADSFEAIVSGLKPDDD